MAEEFVTLATFGDPVEAEMMKNVLAAEGIPAFVQGEMAGGLFPGIGEALGLRLLVAESNLLQAMRVLDEEMEEPPEPEPRAETSIRAPEWRRAADIRPRTDADARYQGQRPEITTESPARPAAIDRPYPTDDDDDDEVDTQEKYRLSWGLERIATWAFIAAICVLLGFFCLGALRFLLRP